MKKKKREKRERCDKNRKDGATPRYGSGEENLPDDLKFTLTRPLLFF